MNKISGSRKKPDWLFHALAEKLYAIWMIQDQRDFGQLEAIAREMFALLGYTSEESDILAYRASTAYRFYGELDDKLPERIDKYAIEDVLNDFEIKIKRMLDVFHHKHRRRIAWHHAKWWVYIFLQGRTQKRRYFFWASSHIFLEHCIKIGSFFPALQCAYFLVMAGYIGHNQRREQVGIELLTKYWKAYLRSDPDRPLMF